MVVTSGADNFLGLALTDPPVIDFLLLGSFPQCASR